LSAVGLSFLRSKPNPAKISRKSPSKPTAKRLGLSAYFCWVGKLGKREMNKIVYLLFINTIRF
jgi:hypothetical protein